MNRYEYGYMQKLAAINKLTTIYNAMKGILRVKVAYGGGSPVPTSTAQQLANNGSFDEIAAALQEPGISRGDRQHLSATMGRKWPGRGLERSSNPVASKPMTTREQFQMSNPTWTPLKGSQEDINPALQERVNALKSGNPANIGPGKAFKSRFDKMEHVVGLPSDSVSKKRERTLDYIYSKAGQGGVNNIGSGLSRDAILGMEEDRLFGKQEAAARYQEYEKSRAKARVAAATTAQADGTAEVSPSNPEPQPQPQPQPEPQPQPQPDTNKAQARVDAANTAQANGTAEVPPPQPQAQPNKLSYGSMALRGGGAAGGALLGGGLGYGAARGLGLYNEDASTTKRMLGHLLTAGGAVGGGIGGYYGGSALDKYLASRRSAK